MSIKNKFGRGFAILGCICMASAAVYWFTSFVLTSNQTGIYNALVFTMVGVVCFGIGYALLDNPGE